MKVKKNKPKVRHFTGKKEHAYIHFKREHCTLIINPKPGEKNHVARDQSYEQEKLKFNF